MIQAWSTDNPDYKLPNGESATELRTRLKLFWDYLLEMSFERALICSHGRAIRAFMTVIFDQPARDMELYGHANTGLFLIRLIQDKPELVLSNDVSHLEKVQV